MFNNSTAKEPPADPFQTEDPFKSDPFQGLNTFLFLLRFHSCFSVRVKIIPYSASCSPACMCPLLNKHFHVIYIHYTCQMMEFE